MREPVQGVHGTAAVQRSVLVRVVADSGAEGWGNVDPTPGYTADVGGGGPRHRRRPGAAPPGARSLQPAPGARDHGPRGGGALRGQGGGQRWRCAISRVARWACPCTRCSAAALGPRHAERVDRHVPPEQAAREARAWLDRGFTTAKIQVSGPGPRGSSAWPRCARRSARGWSCASTFNESLARGEAVGVIRRLEPLRPGARRAADLARRRRRARRDPPRDRDPADGRRERDRAGVADRHHPARGRRHRQGQGDEAGRPDPHPADGRARGGGGAWWSSATASGSRCRRWPRPRSPRAATPSSPGCEAVGPLKMAGDVVTEPARLDAGVIALTDTPGLGASVDPEALKRVTRRLTWVRSCAMRATPAVARGPGQ